MAQSYLRTESDFEQAQKRLLIDLVARLKKTNAFYGDKLSGVDLDAGSTVAEICRQLPMTTKSELVADQRGFAPYGRNLTEPLDHYSRFHQTSGTSGQPLMWLDTAESWAHVVAQWQVIYRQWEVAAGDPVLFCFSFGPFLGFWSAFEAAAGMGCLCIPGGGLDSSARARLIEQHRVKALCCTPTYALRLGDVGRHEGREFGSVSRIFVAGEPGGSIPAVRDRLRTFWPNASVVDHHGMTEVGPVTFADPSDPRNLRAIDTAFITEVIDPHTLDPLDDGQRGELVVTTLRRASMPLIRYRTGDMVRRIPCQLIPDIARGYGFEGGILGRVDDMVVVRGVNVYPAAVDAVVRRLSSVTEYRVRLRLDRRMTEMEIEIEVEDAANADAVAAGLQAEIRSTFALRVPVRVLPAGTLPRFEMKAKRWVREGEQS